MDADAVAGHFGFTLDSAATMLAFDADAVAGNFGFTLDSAATMLALDVEGFLI